MKTLKIHTTKNLLRGKEESSARSTEEASPEVDVQRWNNCTLQNHGTKNVIEQGGVLIDMQQQEVSTHSKQDTKTKG